MKAAFTFPTPHHHEEDEVFRWKMHSLKTCFPSGGSKTKNDSLEVYFAKAADFSNRVIDLAKKGVPLLNSPANSAK